MTSPPSAVQPAADRPLRDLWWVPVAHGAVVTVIGCFLLLTPGRSVAFVATLAGISLLLVAVMDLFAAFGRGLTGGQRIAGLGIAVLAAVAGVVVLARPEGTIRAIAVVAGIYLVVIGVTMLVLGSPPGAARVHARLHGGLALLAGVALLSWPDETVGIVAAIFGGFLVVSGVAEIFFGMALRHGDDTA
jgi:uncharacterized membrane protein HdeD (DUF308 family)